ncbi:MAG: hypothetical protein JWQ81_5989 [Amycolatopsis sp.]|jgi:hypothetical protein|uniref:hypothetical protein n=1 Tax=Amycolatopsis sp. TaxID=37632 RepID=UPI0026019D18|nr:hypothetical protein [Amycolatopsis sp.]MCU1685250.1 hypothetical protein [Amycolatopsis sp.]
MTQGTVTRFKPMARASAADRETQLVMGHARAFRVIHSPLPAPRQSSGEFHAQAARVPQTAA